MQKKWMLTTFILIGMAALAGAAAYGQGDASTSGQTSSKAKARSARGSESQWDIGGSVYEALTSGTSGNGTQQTPTNGIGGMGELRHIVNSFVGYEMTFSYNPANQAYVPKAGACGFACQNPPTAISGNAAEFAIDYVVSHKFGNLRSYALRQ